MTPAAQNILNQLHEKLRPASLATAGGFRPPEDPVTSWFCRGVGYPDEGLPIWKGEPMFPLLQVRIDELPYVPEQIRHLSLLVLFHNLREYPFDLPHGEGWLIREYKTTDNLRLLPPVDHPYRAFPVGWSRIDDDAPGWEEAWNVVDLTAVNEDEAASEAFFSQFKNHSCTKMGGYPTEIQHQVGPGEGRDGLPADFVFQVGSEEKVKWMWADNGIGYFFRSPSGEWRWSCQFY